MIFLYNKICNRKYKVEIHSIGVTTTSIASYIGAILVISKEISYKLKIKRNE